MHPHLLFALAWMGVGMLTGAVLGLRFARADWLGGYGSWPRRMLRLGHVAFFGTALLNVVAHLALGELAATDAALGAGTGADAARLLFVAGAVLMPTTCLLAARFRALRHGFFLPVLSLVGGTALLVWLGLQPLLDNR